MSVWQGPGTPFVSLFDDDQRMGLSLPADVQRIYGGDWPLVERAKRPHVYANFVISHDGLLSYSLPNALNGAAVSQNNPHDQWLMGLLRARADAVLMGDTTLRLEPDHSWTAAWIYPPDADAYAALREMEGRPPLPLLVVASYDGEITPRARAFTHKQGQVMIVSTGAGIARAKALLAEYSHVSYLAAGDDAVDLHAVLSVLRHDYGVRALLCEGGPTLYGSMLAAELIDEEFLTFSPIVVGHRQGGLYRPGLAEGVEFLPSTSPCCRPMTVRRAGDFLFMRSLYTSLYTR